MLKILINAYACSPDMGSEPGMAWNWCVNLARYCELHIITEGEFSDKIEQVAPTLPQGGNMHFYYSPVSEKVRRMCWNQGDWRFYRHYRQWQWRAYLMARDLCNWEHIDILHQLNMIGFREPGYLWKLSEEKDIPFVWGPIGGLKLFPRGFLKQAGWKQRLFNTLKNNITLWQLKHDKRVDAALCTASVLISAIPDSQAAIKRYKGLDSVIIPETGCEPRSIMAPKLPQRELRLLWVGKFDYRKQLELALRAMAKVVDDLRLREGDIRLVVCGTGNDKQVEHYHRLAEELGLGNFADWRGQCGHEAVLKEMEKADLLFFTSVSDDTSTVVMEAISVGLPVLCHDAMGFGHVVDSRCGMKIPLATPKQSVNGFAEKIEFALAHRQQLADMAEGCKQVGQELSWKRKTEEVMEIYNSVARKAAHLVGGNFAHLNCRIVSMPSCANRKKYA